MNNAFQDLEWETTLLCNIVAGNYLGWGAVSLPYWSITCRQTPYDELPKCQTAETYIRACTDFRTIIHLLEKPTNPSSSLSMGFDCKYVLVLKD